MLRKAVTKGQTVFWGYTRSLKKEKTKRTVVSLKPKNTEQKKLKSEIEKSTCALQRVLGMSISGAFVFAVALSALFYVYLII